VAVLQQLVREMRADEAGAADDQVAFAHLALILPKGRSLPERLDAAAASMTLVPRSNPAAIAGVPDEIVIRGPVFCSRGDA
jgi:hypothetical protein